MAEPIWEEKGFPAGFLLGVFAGVAAMVLLILAPVAADRDRYEHELERARIRLDEARSLCRVREARFDL